MRKQQLTLKDCNFQDLQTPEGLQKLDQRFLLALKTSHPHLHEHLLAYRQDQHAFIPEVLSQLLIDCAMVLEIFIAQLFDIEVPAAELQAQTLSHQPIFAFKAYFVRQARRNLGKISLNYFELNQWLENEISFKNLDNDDRELAIAKLGQIYLTDTAVYQPQIAKLIDWCVAVLSSAEGLAAVGHWEMFKVHKHLNFDNLIDLKPVADDEFGRVEGTHFRYRDGFNLTDPRMTERQAMGEVDYCVYCHKNEGDFCSRGFPVKKSEFNKGFKINFAGDTLTGCPLEEKISEMHVLKRDGLAIAALAMVMVDNPMCPMTGHRICNDCMKACIYQKQEPVNIPQTETRILTDVLNLPWGVEIYDLLTRWNPLRFTQWVVKPYNGLKVLVMGMGPAGFSLAHHLLMEGFAVTGMDGLKIEALEDVDVREPIYRYEDIQENLADRLVSGFGGVAEYGITVRWDKNFLKLIYISLLRREYFQIFGNVRFGGTLTVEDAWALGFDHLAVAVGAGLPKELPVPNSLAPGMRQANDFLMALQLTGAAKATSLANLQVRLPAVVIGGGLTAVDTATEVQAYYLVQVEKLAKRYQTLVSHFGEDSVRSRFLAADLPILEESLRHAAELAAERQRAQQEQRNPDLIRLLRQWGGVTIVYRKRLQDSPAYRYNHEELAKALEEGIYYAENLEPQAVILDADRQAQQLRCRQITATDEITLPARAILVATGARLNVAYEFEHRGTFLRSDRFEYRRYERQHGHLQQVNTTAHVKSPHFGAFTSYARDHRRVTFLGDTHPVFHGSVVKAIASAKRVYPEICRLLEPHLTEGSHAEYQTFRKQLQHLFKAQIVSVKPLNQQVVELTVRAPMAAQKGGPGQFYRVQNYGAEAIEGLALLGVRHVNDPELLSFYVLEKGGSSRMVRHWLPGQVVAVMGPTGAHSSPLLTAATILVVGDLISPAFMLAMQEKFLEEGHKVWYLACLEKAEDLYGQDQLEAIAEKVVWLTKTGEIIPRRPQDLSYQGLSVEQVLQQIPELSSVERVWVIGSHCLLQTVQSARNSFLKSVWPQGIPVIGSVYGPMQCMLKGVCAQCLQWQIDPATGKRSKAVYACSWQHQPLEKVDIHHIDERLNQNRCQETLTNLWLDYLQYNALRVASDTLT